MSKRIELFTTNLLALELTEPYDDVLYADFLEIAQELYPLGDIVILKQARSATVTGLHPPITPGAAAILRPILERMSVQPGWRPRPVDPI